MVLLTLALILDWFVGDPDFLWRRVSHPVVLIGKVIDWFDRLRDRSDLPARFNLTKERFDLWMGGGLVLVLLLGSLAIHGVVGSLWGSIGWFVELAIVTILIAQKSLKDHVLDVVDSLRSGGLPKGRVALSMIVGRDVSKLDESGISKAAIESLAENFSDGIVAPVVWYALAGLPGIVFYKAVNTADSMIGHRTEQYEHFGKAAARLDDLLNWPAARLCAILVYAVAWFRDGKAKAQMIWNVVLRDASLHRSPNAGWPETAFAASLGISLGGPRRYGDELVAAPQLHAEGRDALKTIDICSALDLFRDVCFALIGLCVLVYLFL